MSHEHHVVNEFSGGQLSCWLCSGTVPGSLLPVAANMGCIGLVYNLSLLIE